MGVSRPDRGRWPSGSGLTHAQIVGPPRVRPNATIFVENSEFGRALSAAILKKKVPVNVTTNRERADFFMEEGSNATKEGAAERVTKILASVRSRAAGRPTKPA
jgi:hypothetical protein